MTRDPFDSWVSPRRPWLLARGLYTLLALDVWIEMLPHAGRYGVGGFNVAHFAWLGHVLPLPSAALYASLLTASGMLAACCALGPHRPVLRVALLATYTLAWAISMHDSYQHHYLLSWLLLAAASMKVRTAESPPEQLVREPGYVLAIVTCIIVYAFTALSKLAPAWRDGRVMRRLTDSRPTGARSAGALDGVRDTLSALGLEEPVFWRGLALLAVCVQILIAVGYAASIGRDAGGERRARTLACTLGLGCALLFHGAAELSGIFAIGWFSVYMIWLALVALAGHTSLERAAAPLLRALNRRSELWAWPASLRWSSLALSVCAGLVVARHTGIPGLTASFGVTAVLALIGRCASFRVRSWSVALGAACFSACLTLFPVAFDYHRRLAGELLAMGLEPEALAAYREAERVAPTGHSRQAKIRAIERSLSGRGR